MKHGGDVRAQPWRCVEGEDSQDGRGDDEALRRAASVFLAGDHQQGRPEQVELLLDAQRPRVVQHPRMRVQIVRGEGEGPREARRRREHEVHARQDRDHGDVDPVRGQDAQGASQIEGADIHRPGRPALPHDQARDEKSAQDEKHRDAHRTPNVDDAGAERQVTSDLQDLSGVADHDHQGRDRAQPIETRQPLPAKRLRTGSGKHVKSPLHSERAEEEAGRQLAARPTCRTARWTVEEASASSGHPSGRLSSIPGSRRAERSLQKPLQRHASPARMPGHG